MSKTTWITTGSVLIVAAVVAGILLSGSAEAPTPSESKDQAAGQLDKAPTFSLPSLSGETVTLSDIEAPLTIVNIWASWCPFCTKELPDFATLQKEFPNKIRVIAINRGESRQTAKRFVSQAGIADDLTYLLDPDESYYRRMGGFAMPETLFLDAEKRILRHHRGPLSLAQMRRIVNQHLNTTSSYGTSSQGDTLGCTSGQCQLSPQNHGG